MPSMPLAYLTSTLTAIVNGHKQSRINELLPWNFPPECRVHKSQLGRSRQMLVQSFIA